MGVWRAVQERSLSTNRLALAFFDELRPGIADEVPLIKVVQPLEGIGRTSVKIIMDRLGGAWEPQHVVLQPSIVCVGAAVTAAVNK